MGHKSHPPFKAKVGSLITFAVINNCCLAHAIPATTHLEEYFTRSRCSLIPSWPVSGNDTCSLQRHDRWWGEEGRGKEKERALLKLFIFM